MKSPISDFVFLQIQRGDFVFLAVLFFCIFVFVAIESVWLIRQIQKKSVKQSALVWSFIPALVLLLLTKVWS